MHELFVTRNAEKAVRLYFGKPYLQHNPTIPDGADDLPKVVASLPATFKYEPGVIVADGDLVMIHGRYTGMGTETAGNRGHLPGEEWQARRALGRHAGGRSRRSHQKWPPDVPHQTLKITDHIVARAPWGAGQRSPEGRRGKKQRRRDQYG